MVEPITVGIQRMGQCLTAALIFVLFLGTAVAEGKESWQGKEPYELDPRELMKWEDQSREDHPCIDWFMQVRGWHREFSKEDHTDPRSYKESMRFVYPEGSISNKLMVLAIDSTLAGKSVVDVTRLVWDKCRAYRSAGYVDFKDPNPKKRE
mgnify:CR=1 FL=1